MRLLTVCVLMLLTASVSAFAADDKPAKDKDKGAEKSAQAVFKARDTDGNGSLSKDEFVGKAEGRGAEKKTAKFDELDKDRNGSLSFDEFKLGFDAQKADGQKKDKDKSKDNGNEP